MGGERGFTLVELLLAMTMSLVAAGAGLTLLGTIGQRNNENTAYAQRISEAQVSLERMTRELRQANWVQFTSSMVVDLDVPVRPGPTSPAVNRHVRFDCTAGTTCVRLEGPAAPYPVPPAGGAFASSDVALRNLVPGSVVFVPQRVDAGSGNLVVSYARPTNVAIRLALVIPTWDRPVRLDDGVTLRNATTFS